MDSLASALNSLQLGPSVDVSNASFQQVYQTLRESPTSFRFLAIQPAADSSMPLDLRLYTGDLEWAPPHYDAVSYVWGDSTVTSSVRVNGVPFNITVSLHWALKQARDRVAERFVWADAICINQRDLGEQSAQVALMGRIYRGATRVLVCLGPPPEDHPEDPFSVSSLIADTAPLLKIPEPMPWMAKEDERWLALARMVSGKWFTRAWVIQEVGLAKDALVIYGDEEFDYRLLMRILRWQRDTALGTRLLIPMPHIHCQWENWSLPDTDPAHNVTDDDGREWARLEYRFLDLLDHASFLDCQDPRDKVYAFLGHPLAKWPSHDGVEKDTIVQPDYRMPVLAVYRDIAEKLLQIEGLRVLGSCEHTEETIGDTFPSWVVRWDVTLVSNNISQLVDIKIPQSFIAGNGLSLGPGSLLRVTGVVIDRIIKSYRVLLANHPSDTGFEDTSFQWTSGNLGFGDVFRYICRLSTPWAYGISELSPSGEDRALAFAYALCASKDQPRETAKTFCEVLNGTDMDTGSQGLVSMVGRMRAASHNRTFFITASGRYGLGPQICRSGDVILAATASPVLYVLRPQQPVALQQYRYVGEAWLLGMGEKEQREFWTSGGPDGWPITPTEVVIC